MSDAFVMDYDGESVQDKSDTSSKASEVKTKQAWKPEKKHNGITNSKVFYIIIAIVGISLGFLLLLAAGLTCFTILKTNELEKQLNTIERKIVVLNDKIIDLETLAQTNRNRSAEPEDRVSGYFGSGN